MDKYLSAIFVLVSLSQIRALYEVSNLACTPISSRSLQFTWSRPSDPSRNVVGYKLNIQRTDNLVIDVVPEQNINDYYTETYTYSGLTKYGIYTFTLNTYTAIATEPTQTLVCQTLTDVPDQAPATVEAVGISYSEITVDWVEIPQKNRNGVLLGYHIVYYQYISSWPVTITVDNATLHYTITSLDFDTYYLVAVKGFTSAGDGPATTDSNKTLGLPTKAPEVVTKYYCYEAIPGMITFNWDGMPCTVYIGIIGFLFTFCCIFGIGCCVACCGKKPDVDADDMQRSGRSGFRRGHSVAPSYDSDDYNEKQPRSTKSYKNRLPSGSPPDYDEKGPRYNRNRGKMTSGDKWKSPPPNYDEKGLSSNGNQGYLTSRDIWISSPGPSELETDDYEESPRKPSIMPKVGKHIVAKNKAKEEEYDELDEEIKSSKDDDHDSVYYSDESPPATPRTQRVKPRNAEKDGSAVYKNEIQQNKEMPINRFSDDNRSNYSQEDDKLSKYSHEDNNVTEYNHQEDKLSNYSSHSGNRTKNRNQYYENDHGENDMSDYSNNIDDTEQPYQSQLHRSERNINSNYNRKNKDLENGRMFFNSADRNTSDDEDIPPLFKPGSMEADYATSVQSVNVQRNRNIAEESGKKNKFDTKEGKRSPAYFKRNAVGSRNSSDSAKDHQNKQEQYYTESSRADEGKRFIKNNQHIMKFRALRKNNSSPNFQSENYNNVESESEEDNTRLGKSNENSFRSLRKISSSPDFNKEQYTATESQVSAKRTKELSKNSEHSTKFNGLRKNYSSPNFDTDKYNEIGSESREKNHEFNTNKNDFNSLRKSNSSPYFNKEQYNKVVSLSAKERNEYFDEKSHRKGKLGSQDENKGFNKTSENNFRGLRKNNSSPDFSQEQYNNTESQNAEKSKRLSANKQNSITLKGLHKNNSTPNFQEETYNKFESRSQEKYEGSDKSYENSFNNLSKNNSSHKFGDEQNQTLESQRAENRRRLPKTNSSFDLSNKSSNTYGPQSKEESMHSEERTKPDHNKQRSHRVSGLPNGKNQELYDSTGSRNNTVDKSMLDDPNTNNDISYISDEPFYPAVSRGMVENKKIDADKQNNFKFKGQSQNSGVSDLSENWHNGDKLQRTVGPSKLAANKQSNTEHHKQIFDRQSKSSSLEVGFGEQMHSTDAVRRGVEKLELDKNKYTKQHGLHINNNRGPESMGKSGNMHEYQNATETSKFELNAQSSSRVVIEEPHNTSASRSIQENTRPDQKYQSRQNKGLRKNASVPEFSTTSFTTYENENAVDRTDLYKNKPKLRSNDEGFGEHYYKLDYLFLCSISKNNKKVQRDLNRDYLAKSPQP